MLRLLGVHSYYGKSHVIQGLHLEVQENEIATLLGRNGAGKTTTLKTIMGLVPAKEGHILYQGNDITGLKTFEIARLGIGYVPENRQIFSDLTVMENLTIASVKTSQWGIRKIFERFPRLRERAKNKGKQLSGGEQQMLAIARALVNSPNILLLDEPSQGLAPMIINELVNIIDEINKEHISILLVEQNVEMCMKLADHHNIIDQGTIFFSGSRKDLREHPEIQDRYLSLKAIDSQSF